MTSESSDASTPASQHAAINIVPVPQHSSDGGLNIGHLELFHHFLTETTLALSDEPITLNVWTRVVPRYGFRFPFLMYELLAIGALHLGHVRPDSRRHYYDRATELQNSAMARFHALEMKVDESNAGAVLVFSSLLSLQVVADPTPTSGLTSLGYIDHFIQCIKLMQGTRLLVVENLWQSVTSDSDLLPLCEAEHSTPVNSGRVPDEVRQLNKLLDGMDPSNEASSVYEQPIERLQWFYSLSDVPKVTYSIPRWSLGWPVTLKTGFVGMLNEKRSEALVILAYYGVLLHFHRESWVIGDTGRRLVNAIREQLAGHWDAWMQWPVTIVNSA